jgi:CBS domain-containing protein
VAWDRKLIPASIDFFQGKAYNTAREGATITIGEMVKSRPVFTLQQHISVAEAAQYMAEKHRCCSDTGGTRLMGIFSERDVIKRVVARGLDPRTVKVSDVMTRDLVIASEEENEEDCLPKMKQANCRHLPIVSGDQLLGVVSLRDLLQVELTEREEKTGVSE